VTYLAVEHDHHISEMFTHFFFGCELHSNTCLLYSRHVSECSCNQDNTHTIVASWLVSSWVFQLARCVWWQRYSLCSDGHSVSPSHAILFVPTHRFIPMCSPTKKMVVWIFSERKMVYLSEKLHSHWIKQSSVDWESKSHQGNALDAIIGICCV